MSKKNGFTLVELMVVIVIIGVLAAVAIPRLMAAADRARASEGPQILGSIARLQHAFNVEGPGFLPLAFAVAEDTDNGIIASPGADAADWRRLGLEGVPVSGFFGFGVEANSVNFVAIARLTKRLGQASAGDEIWINANDNKGATTADLNNLVRSFTGKDAHAAKPAL